MAHSHRRSEVAKALPKARAAAQSQLELSANWALLGSQITLWGGVDTQDFNGTDEDADAIARRDETTQAMASAAALEATLDEPCPLNEAITNRQAIARIADR